MFKDSLEANPECDIFGEPHVGYEEAHKNLTNAYTNLLAEHSLHTAAMTLVNSGVYWTPELLRKNYNHKRQHVFDLAISALEAVKERK
jgi:hypothetical protein